MENNKDDPGKEKARIDYGFYTKIAKELLNRLEEQNRALTQTLDDYTHAVQLSCEAKRILEGK